MKTYNFIARCDRITPYCAYVLIDRKPDKGELLLKTIEAESCADACRYIEQNTRYYRANNYGTHFFLSDSYSY